MAKAMRKYFRENFDGAEIGNIQPSESFPIYGTLHLIDVYDAAIAELEIKI